MKFVEYFRNLDSKKQAIIAGALVITLTGGSMALKLHKEHTNPSTPPASAAEIKDNAKDKMTAQLKSEPATEKAKNKKSSNDVNLVPYNVDGSLGGGYNSTPLSLGGDYNYTPTLEPAVYEPIADTMEFVEPVEEPIVNKVVKPVVPNEVVGPTAPNEEGLEEGIVEVPNETIKPIVPNEPTKPTVPNEEELEKDNSLDIIKSATYKGKNIAFFVDKYLQGNVTYNYQQINNKHVLTVKGDGLFIRFNKVGEGDYDCTELVKDGQELTGMERDKVLNEIFNIQDGSNVPTPPEPPVIEVPDPNQPVEPEQPPVKDDKVETEDNTSVTPPPVTPPTEIQEN